MKNYFFFRVVKRLKIASVRYINTFPFIYGLRETRFNFDLDVVLDTPSECRELFAANKADVALVPVAGLIGLDNYLQFSDYCIGCEGAVKTVALFSNDPVETAGTVYLDRDSLSSVELAKFLIENFWHKEVQYRVCDVGNIKLKRNEAVLKIGDKAFKSYNQFKFSYDLGNYWAKMMNLPFVFAVWVANPKLSSDILLELNNAFQYGIESIGLVIERYREEFPNIDLEEYYSQFISYDLNDAKKLAQNRFMDILQNKNLEIEIGAEHF